MSFPSRKHLKDVPHKIRWEFKKKKEDAEK